MGLAVGLPNDALVGAPVSLPSEMSHGRARVPCTIRGEIFFTTRL